MVTPHVEDDAGRGAEDRVSVLVGDRLCTRCGYNLTGQPVVREPHYRLLIVRCPECATVASLQEYPLLGRWVGRWTALLAALWLLLTLALFVASGGIVHLMAQTTGHEASRLHARHLAALQKEHFLTQKANGVTLPQNVDWIIQSSPFEYVQIEPSWGRKQDFAALLAEQGGWIGAADFRALLMWIPLALVAFIIGCVWSVVMLARPRRSLPLVALAIVALATVFAALATFVQRQMGAAWSWVPAIQIAQRAIGTPFTFMSLAFALIPLTLGTQAGRPLVRGMVRAFLPPRLRGGLAILWTAEGKTPAR